MKKKWVLLTLILLSITFSVLALFMFPKPEIVSAQASPSRCITSPINIGVEKKLLPLDTDCQSSTGYLYCGRGKQPGIPPAPPGTFGPSPDCVTPTTIVMHTTHDGSTTADQVYSYFAGGSGGRHVGSHFAIGDDGTILQMVEMGQTQVEYAQTVGDFQPHISIEQTHTGNYGSKAEAPAAQYQAALQLVKSLQQIYNIPDSQVLGHYDIWPVAEGGAGDPGVGWMLDFRADLPSAQPLPGTGTGTGTSGSSQVCITQVGSPSASPPGPLGCTGGGGGGGGGIPSDFVQAGEQIKAAYDQCGNGFTFDDISGLPTCFFNYIKNISSDAHAQLVESRRQQSLVDSADVAGGRCTECPGFIGIAVTHWTNSNDPCCNLSYYAAGDINDLGGSFRAGQYTFKSIGSGVLAIIQSGDIAVAGGGGNPGHIAIVKDVSGYAGFIALESNAGLDCKVTDNRVVPKDNYTFYRKQ